MSRHIKATVLAAAVACAAVSAVAAGLPPISIAKQGVFFVGGRYSQVKAGTVMDGQMFVQFQIPAQKKHPFPIILVHGQGQSGVNYLSTPDGREGWADYFIRHGYAVYVVDQVMRGRSDYHPELDGPKTPFSAETIQDRFTHPEGAELAWPVAKLHTQWPGSGTKGDPAFDQFYASELESTTDGSPKMDADNRDALVALLQKIGPSILLTHSRSGPFGWIVGDARPDLVRAIVAVEPSGIPFGGGGRGDTPAKPWGPSTEPLAYEPAVLDPAELQPHREKDCWVTGGIHRSLPRLAEVPVLMLTGEASYHATSDHCMAEFLTVMGVKTDWFPLGTVGIHGNNHMMMLEKNNQEIAAFIDRWLTKTVTAKK